MNITDALGIGSLIVAIATIIWGIRQTFVTNRLTQEIHRLSVRLDQSIQRLERARELINNMCMVWEDFGNRLHVEGKYDRSDLVKVLTVNRGSRIELYALPNVIGDKQLFDTLRKLDRALKKKIGTEKPEQLLEWLSRLEKHFEALHKRVYELMEDATLEQKH